MSVEKTNEFWPEWKIKEIIGEGSFGKVYKAERNMMGFSDFSAIKQISIPPNRAEYDALRSEGLSEDDTKEYFRDIVEDFITEIKLMTTLKGAPNIVTVEDYILIEKSDEIGYDIFIRMELLHSFKELSKDNAPSEDMILKMALDITNALEICQQRNIIHRDIKPANIFFDDFGNFKLGDFGIAKELEKTTGASSAKGTFSFMAPEVAHGKRYNNTVDIYSLGLMLYTLLNGNRPPFIPSDSRITYNERKSANDRRLSGEALPKIEGVSDALNNIILTACAYDPAKRFKSATAFNNALLSYKNAQKPPVAAPKTTLNETVAPRTPKVMSPVLEPTIAASHKTSAKNEETASSPKTKKKKVGLIAIIVILLIAVSSILFVPSLLDKSNTTDNKNQKKETTESSTQSKSDKESVQESDTVNELIVPDLLNQIYTNELQDKLTKDGFKVKVAYSEDSDQEAGTIIGQNPEKETVLTKDDNEIYLTLSRGESSVILNDYTVKPYTELEDYLDQNNIKYDKIYEDNDVIPKDHVIRTDPVAGESVKIGDTVTIYISKGVATTDDTTDKETDISVPSSINIGDTVTFGSYEQDDNKSNGTEAIEWTVLATENGKALVISTKGLVAKPYNDSYFFTSWGESNLRNWLNNDFYTTAFDETEKSTINTTSVLTDGVTTEDNIFILSIDEAESYYNTSADRKCDCTVSAAPYVEWWGNRWWLRDVVGTMDVDAAYVDENGVIKSSGGAVINDETLVRPVMWIDIA